MDEISVNDDDDHEEEDEGWDIGLSSTCSKQAPFEPPSENHNDAEVTEDDDDYDDDYDDNYDDDDDDDRDDNDDDDRDKLELGCPYCTENLDILGLCCHIDDQHYKEAKSGICPICSKRLETSMTVHIIAQHESILRALCKKKFRGGGTHTDLHLLKIKESSRSQLEASSRVDPSYDLSSDLLLLSFVQNSKPAHRSETVQAGCPPESGLSRNSSNDDLVERNIEDLSSLTSKLQDKARVCEFVNGLVFSTIFDDGS